MLDLIEPAKTIDDVQYLTPKTIHKEDTMQKLYDVNLEPEPETETMFIDIDSEISELDTKPTFDPTEYLIYKALVQTLKWQETKIDKLDVQLKPQKEKSVSAQEPQDIEFKKLPESPDSILHDVWFYAQAPTGNRDQPRQDACEEASIILGAYGLKQKSLSRQKFTQEIQYLVQLQNKLFGSYVDTTIAQTKELYDTYYGIWTSMILDQPSIQDLKDALTQWHLIVAPFAGKKLWNPNYNNGWPRYHMMLLVWYDKTHFVVHDVGTRHGQNYRYTHSVIMDSLYDFVPITDGSITQGASRVLVLQK